MSEEAVKPAVSIRHWKRADTMFTDDDKANIALALGMPIEAVQWEIVDGEVCDDVAGHSLVGTSSP